MNGPWFFLRVMGLVAGSKGACLPKATAEVDRRDLVNVVAGESYSIGLWKTGNYAAAHLTTAVVQIMVEEMLGYNTELKGTGGLAVDAFYALMGCTNPLGNADRGCGRSVTYVHINVEAWQEGYVDEWAQVQAQYPKVAPINLGNGGYSGTSGMYVPLAVQQKAYQAEGISLDFYRDYNMSWRTPGSYFSPPGDMDVSRLLPCADTVLMSNAHMGVYFDFTGDAEGVVVDSEGFVVAKCFADHFWYAPACRADPGTCLTWLTAGTGWGMPEGWLKATIYNIPLATAVASTFQNYANLPTDFNVMLFWWVPDPTFLRLKPRKVIFPEYDREEWARGDRRSAVRDFSVDKLVSWDLRLLAPEVEEFITRFQLSPKAVDEMMLDQLDTTDVDFDVACRWLRSNEQEWKTWLPESGKCSPQFGMYSEKDEKFLQTREEVKITCRACPSGFFSSQLEDAQGITFICQECPSGSFQVSGASVSCTPCPAGSYQNETGSLACNRCPVGQYQDEEGQRDCKLCPAGATTLLLGSNSILDCGCKAGSINVASVATNVTSKALECIPCQEGFDCPFSSSVQALLTGQPSSSEQLATRIQSGYFATVNDPLQLFRCRPAAWCPGGMPGTCAGGLKGEPCSFCPDGKSWAGDKCADCGAAAVGWVAAVSLALIGVRTAYFYSNSAVTAQATPWRTVQMTVRLAVNVMQSLALFGLMSAKWPETFEQISSSLQIFVLDMKNLNLNCLLGGNSVLSYVASTVVFPLVLLWLVICHAGSHLICSRKCGLHRWKWPFTFNTMGLFLQLGFGTMAAVSMKPMMCYRHPNGRHSVVSYPSILCGEAGHGLMVLFGILSLILLVGFVALCSYAVWKLPRWSLEGEYKKAQSFRFCTWNFRSDTYGFIVALLCRGLGFAVAVVVGTNAPPVQTGLASMVLITYAVMQAWLRPWKAPVINVADAVLSACLVVLANRSSHEDGLLEEEFQEYFTLLILLLTFACLASLVLLCIVGVALQLAGVDWNCVLSGGGHDATKIAQSLKQCAEWLMKLETAHLQSEIEAMNPYDVMTILNLISVIEADIQNTKPDRSDRATTTSNRSSGRGVSHSTSRVRLAALNASITVLSGPAEWNFTNLQGPTDPKPEVETDACEVHHPGAKSSESDQPPQQANTPNTLLPGVMPTSRARFESDPVDLS